MKKAFKTLICTVAAAVALSLVCTAAACGGGETNDEPVDTDTTTVSSVEIGRASYTIYTQNDDGYATSVTIDYQVIYSDFTVASSDATATWRSSDDTIATVSSSGVVTAVSAGTVSIRVSVGGKSDTCTVTVTDYSSMTIRDTGITVDPTSYTLTEVGATVQLTATVSPANASDQTVTWSSYNTSVATVDENGLVTAVAGGTASIEAKSANNYTAICVITVAGEDVEEAKSDLYVSKVSALSERSEDSPFIMALDASEVPSIEAARTEGAGEESAYYDYDGNPVDIFEFLADCGITDIRVRIWNNPNTTAGVSYGGGNCDVDNAVAIAERLEAAGLGMIVDFQYSDFWADPAKQTVPKDWASYTTNQIASAIYTYTKESLESISATGVNITMVQIGNEINSGMCGQLGTTSNSYYVDWDIVCSYLTQASAAVRYVSAETDYPNAADAKIAVHFTDAGSNGLAGYAKTLNDYGTSGVDYDVFGVSWYPYYSSHGTLANLTSQLKSIHSSYGKDVMVLETAYAYSQADYDGLGNTTLESTDADAHIPITVQGQSNAVQSVISAIAGLGDYGLGISYWGGLWIGASSSSSSTTNRQLCNTYGCGWASSAASEYDQDVSTTGGSQVDNQTFFDNEGKPLESLKVFSLVYEGQTTALTVDYSDTEEIYYEVNSGTIEMPTSVNVVFNNGSYQAMSTPMIWWDVTDEELAEYIQTPDKYVVTGSTVQGGTITCNVWVTYPNKLTEGSFENLTSYEEGTEKFVQGSGLGDWTITNNNSKSSAYLQLYVSNASQNADMGSNSFHFWDETDVNFDLTQTISASKLDSNGYYAASFDIQGNDAQTSNIYCYVIITYNDGTTKEVTSDTVTLDGWQTWNKCMISGIEIDDYTAVASITYGIHVEGTIEVDTSGNVIGAGPWGNIDNCQFYYAGDTI